MHTATAVDGYWLAELGPMFFSVKVKALHFSHCPCELVLMFVKSSGEGRWVAEQEGSFEPSSQDGGGDEAGRGEDEGRQGGQGGGQGEGEKAPDCGHSWRPGLCYSKKDTSKIWTLNWECDITYLMFLVLEMCSIYLFLTMQQGKPFCS